MIKKLIKNVISLENRKWLKQQLKFIKNFWNGKSRLIAKKNNKKLKINYKVSLSQPIKNNEGSQPKIHNLKKAINEIEQITIAPNKIFSFWYSIPYPSQKNGFQKGRNIINGKLTLDYGGGLCQLSGILYHLALVGGLGIIERHSHSLDIYTEENRYTPLGSDATVSCGLKDLQIKNTYPFPIKFTFDLREEEIIGHICAEKKLKEYKVSFIREKINDSKEKVSTNRVLDNKSEHICVTTYKR